MLRLLRDEVEVVLTPSHVALAGAPPWSGALAALEQEFDGLAGRRITLQVILSNRFVRYAVVPWQTGLHGPAEEQAYVRHYFVQTYGSAADSWDLCVSPAPDGQPRLASAIDSDLLDALRGLCSAKRIHLAAVLPQLASTFNRHREILRAGCGWLVLAEANSVCIALFDSGRWLSVGTARTASWQQDLPSLLEREVLLANPAGAADQVFWWSADGGGE
ncbi:MAG: hypothetical protein JWQ01_3480, partial [Massilia sp.]|nr:hypothetical protein [Massilia sp.]